MRRFIDENEYMAMSEADARTVRDHVYGPPEDYPEELGMADQVLSESLESLRMLSHDDWEMAIQRAMEQNWRLGDLDILRAAQTIANMGGPKYEDRSRIYPYHGRHSHRSAPPEAKFWSRDDLPRYDPHIYRPGERLGERRY